MSRAYQRVVLADGPVGYWPLDELSGTTAYDLGSAGSNGTYTNSGVAPVLGAFPFPAGGRAPFFSAGGVGSGGRVVISDSASWSGASNDLTVEAWVFPTTTLSDTSANGRRMIVSKAGSSGSNYEWWMYANSFSTDGSPNAWAVRTNQPTATPSTTNVSATGYHYPGRWHHLAWQWTQSGSGSVLWVNGNRQGFNTTGTGMTDTTGELNIGMRGDGPFYPWDGGIAHVAIYTKVLSQARIQAHTEAGIRQRQRR